MKAVICPTVTAYDLDTYAQQIRAISGFAERIHVDLMDGELAPTMSPPIDQLWLPHNITCDVHVMYKRPMEILDQLIAMKPYTVIIHYEADVHHMHFASELHKHGIEAGLAILPTTPLEETYQVMHSFDQVLLFSGNLGHHGGKADLSLLERVTQIKEHHIDAEIAWDGGINNQNIRELVSGGVEVMNVGGYIQKSQDPKRTYKSLLGELKHIDK